MDHPPVVLLLLSEVFLKNKSYTLCGECGLGEVFVICLVVTFNAYSFTSLVRNEQVLELKVTYKV